MSSSTDIMGNYSRTPKAACMLIALLGLCFTFTPVLVQDSFGLYSHKQQLQSQTEIIIDSDIRADTDDIDDIYPPDIAFNFSIPYFPDAGAYLERASILSSFSTANHPIRAPPFS